MSKTQELQIKNKYTGEVIRTIPADTQETLQAKIKNAHKKDYFRSKIFHYLSPALIELEEKNYFAFRAPERGKYDLEAQYTVERLYPLKRDDASPEPPPPGENVTLT